MRALKNIAGALGIAGFVLISPMDHAAQAQVYHRSSHTVVRTRAYVPSTNPYDNGHPNVINKTRERWRNVKQTVRYDTYRLSHHGKTSAAEQAQDRARERQDQRHEAQVARQR